ncbi:hypothetical protein NDU88_002710 [Pleurodeles waltl]|uniref:Uncharacterized protein n=1 Tax=Pleurodeles waltl TaxID=8319 RepID=A0AAV7V0G7_PLEWA|nr:hypothetical protein NDU88_002710 [Pleurodeles waltl]
MQRLLPGGTGTRSLLDRNWEQPVADPNLKCVKSASAAGSFGFRNSGKSSYQCRLRCSIGKYCCFVDVLRSAPKR